MLQVEDTSCSCKNAGSDASRDAVCEWHQNTLADPTWKIRRSHRMVDWTTHPGLNDPSPIVPHSDPFRPLSRAVPLKAMGKGPLSSLPRWASFLISLEWSLTVYLTIQRTGDGLEWFGVESHASMMSVSPMHAPATYLTVGSKEEPRSYKTNTCSVPSYKFVYSLVIGPGECEWDAPAEIRSFQAPPPGEGRTLGQGSSI